MKLPERATAVAARDRSAAYDAFEKYEAARCSAGASDLCDFVQHVHRAVVAGAVHGRGLHSSTFRLNVSACCATGGA